MTNRQRNLLNLVNQLSQNLINDTSSVNSNLSVDLPRFDFNAGVNVDVGTGSGTDTPTEPAPPQGPSTVREVLMNLVNEQVEVTTPFGPVSGTLLAVKNDYIVLIEADGSQALVRIPKIELVSEL
ncbi:DUF2642 domain-containing protein [Lentibacillus juripiscarius]|uniref:DUF2642 domain-containing protein n=1 Tax=Lentibacillus juripiscarius TaxID=257446 RepID=A0ABW5V3I1_9BACI